MKYYLTTIQYNKVAKAENRTIPKVYTSLDDAEADFYEQVGKDMKNNSLGGSLNYVTNSEGGTYESLNKKWGFMEEPIVEPTEIPTEKVAEE